MKLLCFSLFSLPLTSYDSNATKTPQQVLVGLGHAQTNTYSSDKVGNQCNCSVQVIEKHRKY